MGTRSKLHFAGGALAALVLAAGLGACTPGTDISSSESDVVATVFDPEVDFGAFTTVAIADSVLHLTADGSDDPNISRAYDEVILDRFQTNLEGLGYTVTRVDSLTQSMQPDLVLLIGVTSSDFYYANWGCGGYWGYWWYYPPYGCYGPPTASYAYSTGTLVASLIDPAKIDDVNEVIPTDWVGAINAVLSSGNPSQRLTRNIDQLFAQSPYLGRSR